MKISAVLVSNRPKKFEAFAKTLTLLDEHFSDVEKIVLCQSPLEPELCAQYGFRAIVDRAYPKSEPLPFVRWKGTLLSEAQGEYILSYDDDHTLVPGSSKYMSECIEYMDNNPSVGAMSTCGIFGSVAWGDKIKKNPQSKIMMTNRGMIFRNIPELTPTEEELELVGATHECLFLLKVAAAGYDFAKRFKNPTKQEPTKRDNHPGYGHYQTAVVLANITSYVRRRWNDPSWHQDKARYPAGVIRENAINFKKKFGGPL